MSWTNNFDSIAIFIIPVIVCCGIGFLLAGKRLLELAVSSIFLIPFALFTTLYYILSGFFDRWRKAVFSSEYPGMSPTAGDGFGIMIFIGVFCFCLVFASAAAIILTLHNRNKEKKKFL